MITLPEIPEYSFTGTKTLFTNKQINNKTYPMLHLSELYERDMIINETIITPTYPRTTFAICFWQFAFVKQFIFFLFLCRTNRKLFAF
jgi:hypothetical protein